MLKQIPQAATACVGKNVIVRSSPIKGENIVEKLTNCGPVAIIQNNGAKVR